MSPLKPDESSAASLRSLSFPKGSFVFNRDNTDPTASEDIVSRCSRNDLSSQQA